MNIASVQMQSEVSRSNSTVEPKKDEFSNVLSQVVSKDSNSSSKNEKISKEPKEENEEEVKDLVDSLALLNITFIEAVEPNSIPEEVLSAATETDGLNIDNAPIPMTNDVELPAVLFNTKLTSTENATVVEEASNLDFNENIKFTEAISSIEVEKMPVFEDVLSSKEADENMHQVKHNSSLEGDITPKITDSPMNKIIPDESFNQDNLKREDISVNSNLEVKKELEPLENDITETKNQDMKVVDGNHSKEFNNVSMKTIESKEPIQLNDNMQKINDTIIQLMETTTEGNTNVVKVKLYPEDLGTVNVTLRMEEGRLIAKILVDNDYVKGLFTNRVNELNESLVKQNIHLEKINIDLNLNSNSNNNSSFDLNQNGSYGHGRENHSKRNKYGTFITENVNTTIHEERILNSGAISILA